MEEVELYNTIKAIGVSKVINKDNIKYSHIQQEIIKTCGSLWALGLVTVSEKGYTEFSEWSLDHAKLIHKIGPIYCTRYKDGFAAPNSSTRLLDGTFSDDFYAVLTKIYKLGKGKIEIFKSTQEEMSYVEIEKVLRSLVDDTIPYLIEYKLLDRVQAIRYRMTHASMSFLTLVDKATEIMLEYLVDKYGITLPNVTQGNKYKFVYGLIAFEIFPKSEIILSDYKAGTPYKESKQVFRYNLLKLYNKVRIYNSDSYNYTLCILLGIIGYSERDAKEDIARLENKYIYPDEQLHMLILKAIRGKDDIEWDEPECIIESSGKHLIMNIKLKDNLDHASWSRVITHFSNLGYKYIKDIINAMLNGSLYSKENTNKYTWTPPYKMVHSMLLDLGYAELIDINYKNTPEQDKMLTKLKLLGYDTNWLLSDDTRIADLLDICRNKLTAQDIDNLGEHIDATVAHVIDRYNGGMHNTAIEAALKFQDALRYLGFGEVLTYNYQLEALNTKGRRAEEWLV